jgi:polyisoprenoid-binding protein YceI
MLLLIPAAALVVASGQSDATATPTTLAGGSISEVIGPDGGFSLGFDEAHSSVGFSVKHMVVATVKGTFNEWEGTVWFNPEEPSESKIDISINVASVDTENGGRDTHLRSPDFFDAESYPHITFKSEQVEERKDGWVAVGDLKIRDVTKRVEMPFDLLGPVQGMGQTRYGADARLEINRQDWGVSWSRTLDAGGLVVSNKVVIEIHVELIVE